MSLLKKIKENLSKREEDEIEVSQDEEDFVEIPTMLPSFTFYGHNWLVAPFMSHIFEGRFDLIPVECVLTMYILRCYNICYYVVLDNSETGDDFSVYEFEWIGADGERTHCVSEHGSHEHGSHENEHGERTHCVSEHGSHEHGEKQEDKDPEFVEYATNMTALDAGKFLRDKIGEGYYIYIQERV
jgi:hypothetical protein